MKEELEGLVGAALCADGILSDTRPLTFRFNNELKRRRFLESVEISFKQVIIVSPPTNLGKQDQLVSMILLPEKEI